MENIKYKINGIEYNSVPSKKQIKELSACNILREVNSLINRKEVIKWFNENNIDYHRMNDLEMYIHFIENANVFDYPQLAPDETVREILDEFQENKGITDNCFILKERLESVGYTIDIEEDFAITSNLRKL